MTAIILIGLLIYLASLCWAIGDIFRNSDFSKSKKFFWLLICVVSFPLGIISYFMVGRNKYKTITEEDIYRKGS